jgi:hypothetical protein
MIENTEAHPDHLQAQLHRSNGNLIAAARRFKYPTTQNGEQLVKE